MNWAVLFIFCKLSFDPLVVEDHFDMVEINHLYNDNGNLVLDQIIYWDWEGDNFHVVDWRPIKDGRETLTSKEYNIRKNQQPMFRGERLPVVPKWVGSQMVPVKRDNIYRVIWWDGNVLRKVTCDVLMTTWTQNDPELEDRELWPKIRRRGLSKKLLYNNKITK